MSLPLPADLRVDEIPALRRSMRVAFVTETYPPEVNGVATTVVHFVQGLHRAGHDVQLVRPRQHDGDGVAAAGFPEVLMRGMPIPRYPHLKMGLPCRRALLRLWERQRPDVVHVATEGPLGWSALHAAVQLGLPVTSDFRTNFHAYSRHYGIGWLQRPIQRYLRGFHNRCAVTMVPTEALRAELAAAGFERLAVVPRGVDTQHFAPAARREALRAQWGAGPQDLVVGTVGRLAPEKNLALLLEAFAAVRREQPGAKLVFVGDGPLRAELQAACPDAVFAGLRGGADLASHYASLDVFAFPSQTETFGNVTAEALASGLPLVAFRHAAAGELIDDGIDGLLAECGDDAGFVAHAVALARDPALRRRLGTQARGLALELGWDSVLARFECHLLAACAAASHVPESAQLLAA